MKIEVRNTQGHVVRSVQVRDDVFGAPSNPSLVHQVTVGQLANARQGTASTKTRAEVSGGGRKPRPQKHTGGARQGSIRAPQWRGGGTVFGPRPRNYRHRTPRRMRRLSLIIALSEKVRDGELVVLEALTLEKPRTAELARVLAALDASHKTLLVADGTDPSVLRSGRNIPRLKMMPASLLNTLDVINHRKVVMTEDAVRKAEELWGGATLRRKGASASAALEA